MKNISHDLNEWPRSYTPSVSLSTVPIKLTVTEALLGSFDSNVRVAVLAPVKVGVNFIRNLQPPSGSKGCTVWSILIVSGQLFSCMNRFASVPLIVALFMISDSDPVFVIYTNFCVVLPIAPSISRDGWTEKFSYFF